MTMKVVPAPMHPRMLSCSLIECAWSCSHPSNDRTPYATTYSMISLSPPAAYSGLHAM